MSLEYIDTHAHLAAPEFKDDIDQVILRADQAAVSKMVCIGAGYGVKSAEDTIALVKKYDSLYAAVGLHPCDSFEKIKLEWLIGLAGNPKVVALGETGLDYYWKKADPEIQKYNFIIHIQAAKQLGLPLVIHSREAANDCLQILIENDAQKVGGVFHCYSEGIEFAEKLRAINFKVSFPGVLTFKKADLMREVARAIPLEQIMIETDCPFLAPQSFRGKRCEPAYVVEVAKTLAAIKGLSLEEVARVTTENARKFYSI